jgi:hypothetical protein
LHELVSNRAAALHDPTNRPAAPDHLIVVGVTFAITVARSAMVSGSVIEAVNSSFPSANGEPLGRTSA